MDALKTGTRLKDEYGTWPVYERTVFDGVLRYDLVSGNKWKTCFPREIGERYEVVFCPPKDCRNDFFTEEV